ncbi:FkbM family methyltransferase, partial [Patescibacteria group bacterium]
KRDTNLNIGVSSKSGNMVFYKFFPDTLSTFSSDLANNYIKQGFVLEEKRKVRVIPLSKVLQKYCFGKSIDFISVDTEGSDLEVLQSNDWEKFSPTLVCVELTNHTSEELVDQKDRKCYDFLENKGYREVFRNKLNSVFEFQNKKL